MICRGFGAILLSSVAACQQPAFPYPDAPTINRIEQALSRSGACGPLSHWQRSYSYGYTRSRVDPDSNLVVVLLQEAGNFGFRSRRRIADPADARVIDERIYDMCYVKFDRRTQVMSVALNNQLLSHPITFRRFRLTANAIIPAAPHARPGDRP